MIKKMLSVLMLFCMLLSFAIPAMANEAQPPNPDAVAPALNADKPLPGKIYMSAQGKDGQALYGAVFEIYAGLDLKETGLY